MSTIKNYDSRSKLSNYQIGSIYTFYRHNINMNRLVSDTISGMQRIAYKISPRSAWSEG